MKQNIKLLESKNMKAQKIDIPRQRKFCDQMLMAMIGRQELVESWWQSPNKAFEDATPDAVWDVDPMLVVRYLMGHTYSGSYY
jgi:hypothetical protein